MPRPLLRLTALLGAALLLTAGRAGAQEAPPKPEAKGAAVTEEKADGLPFWDTTQGINVSAAATLLGPRDPVALVMTRVAGSEQPLLPDWQLINDRAPPLPSRLFAKMKDDSEVPDFSGKKDVPPEGWALYWTMNDAVVLASITPAEAFAKSAEENAHVTFTHLFREPARFRGQVVPVKGRLIRVRKHDAMLPAKKAGIPFVYEGWIAGPTKHVNPFAVLFTELPEGLPLAEQMDRPVTFHGYFLQRVAYDAPKDKRKTPLLVGRSVILEGPPPAAPSTADQAPVSFAKYVLYAVIGGLIVLSALFFFLNMWFRRGDAQVRSRLAELRERQVGEPGADPFVDEPETPAPAPAEGANGNPAGPHEPHQGGPAAGDDPARPERAAE